MVQGYSRRFIASELRLSHNALTAAVQNIYLKLGLEFHWHYDRHTIMVLWGLGMAKLPQGDGAEVEDPDRSRGCSMNRHSRSIGGEWRYRDHPAGPYQTEELLRRCWGWPSGEALGE